MQWHAIGLPKPIYGRKPWFFQAIGIVWDPLKRGPWCPEEDSNLHDLAIAST